MGFGTSLLLIAIGAILKWAVSFHTTGIHLAIVGVILMIIGVAGLLASLVAVVARTDRRAIRDREAHPR